MSCALHAASFLACCTSHEPARQRLSQSSPTPVVCRKRAHAERPLVRPVGGDGFRAAGAKAAAERARACRRRRSSPSGCSMCSRQTRRAACGWCTRSCELLNRMRLRVRASLWVRARCSCVRACARARAFARFGLVGSDAIVRRRSHTNRQCARPRSARSIGAAEEAPASRHALPQGMPLWPAVAEPLRDTTPCTRTHARTHARTHSSAYAFV